jgi:hypothetical protein
MIVLQGGVVKPTPQPPAILEDHPVTGGHKYRDLVLQVGGWMQG